MLTFKQFLEQKYGLGTGHSPAKILARGVSKPASPGRPRYTGLSVGHVFKKRIK